MLTGIDHVVILVADLQSAIRSYQEQGYTVVRGGRHPTGTHNALIGLADGSYLELLAFYEPRPTSKWWPKLCQGGGFITACMRTDDLRGEITRFRSAGIHMSDPLPLSRVRPDGYHIKWVLSLPQCEHPDVVPFLIEDETPREERVPQEHTHSNAVTGIGTAAFAVRNPTSLRSAYAMVLGTDGEEIHNDTLNAIGVRFVVGLQRIEFLAPKSGDGPIEEWLRARGPAPISLTLTSASGDRALFDQIPIALTARGNRKP